MDRAHQNLNQCRKSRGFDLNWNLDVARKKLLNLPLFFLSKALLYLRNLSISKILIISNNSVSQTSLANISLPVNTRRYLDFVSTSFERRGRQMDVETTLFANIKLVVTPLSKSAIKTTSNWHLVDVKEVLFSSPFSINVVTFLCSVYVFQSRQSSSKNNSFFFQFAEGKKQIL